MRLFACIFTIIFTFTIMGCNSQAESELYLATGPTAVATFAGGCFWCMEPPFDRIDGVISTTSGYTGGKTKNPSYRQVASGRTGHTEALQIVYDTSRISFSELLEIFWRNVDPTTDKRQFCDKGNQYRPMIFYHDEEQRKAAIASKDVIISKKTFSETIKVEIDMASTFYAAEERHQDYYKKNPIRYNYYRRACGRDKRLKELWGDSIS
ncbi:MAG: peptide-methionine (S)-S-oxide reductase MsrA [Gammaproteobacteria bacterium]|jgi:peptide-methionine (S)-S-oxide reductase|nr:peptide-methionine (S)-S-oxide reductase MsrA [Gammaproteobacteria bacterium]